MGRRYTRGGMLSMMDAPELRGLAAFMRRGHWLRDPEGHPGGGDTGEDHPDDPGSDDDGDGDEDEDGDSDGDDDKSDDDKDDDTDPDDKPKYSEREYAKIKKRMVAADKAKNDALRKLADLQKNGSAELDKQTKAEIEALKPKADKLEKDNASLRLR
jgi:ABC-type Zn2+ transport system substrate-binding protein/surface adhesin